jgi:hypothetical protein
VSGYGAPYCNLHRADLHTALTDANGVQLAARYQRTQHHGSTASGANSGKTAAALGLFSYNPVTEPI